MIFKSNVPVLLYVRDHSSSLKFNLIAIKIKESNDEVMMPWPSLSARNIIHVRCFPCEIVSVIMSSFGDGVCYEDVRNVRTR